MEENTAILQARRFLQRHQVTSVPVNVMELAAAESFEVKLKDLPEGEAGSTLTRGGRRIILVNNRDPAARQRFTILHEIAHHVLNLPSVHGEADLPVDEALKGPPKRPPEEVACDAFASECLMPRASLKPLTEQLPFGLTTVEELAKTFEASRHCVASQFVKASAECVAFVVSANGRITLAFASAALRDAGVRLARRVTVPLGSAAQALVGGEDGATATADTEGADWSLDDSAARFSVYEEASFYAPLKLTYSLLTFEEVESPQRARNTSSCDHDEDMLPELTGELRWKSRKS